MNSFKLFPVIRAVPVLTEAELMEAKLREKRQAHASSHGLQSVERDSNRASTQTTRSEVDRLLR